MDILFVFILLLISAFFSAAETSVTSASRGKIHKLSNEGNLKAKKVEQLLKNKENLIGTVLLGNNSVTILASAFTTSVLIGIFGESGVLYATIIITFLVLIFGEIGPKTYALKNAEKTALFCAPSLLIITRIFSPITKSIHQMIDFFINPPVSGKQALISELDEIRGTIDLKHKEGIMFKYDKDMINTILDLGEIEIGDVIIHRRNIKSINIEQNLEEIIKQAFDINHTIIPLWKGDKDNIVAVLNMRKLIKLLHQHRGNLEKINLHSLTSKPWFVPVTNNLKSQLFAFRKRPDKLAIVIDEYGVLMGVITLKDILEEIVGNISEDGEESNKVIKVKNGAYQISGEMPIRDINRKLNWNLPEGDDNASTLAGLVIAKAEKIPEEEEEFKFEGFAFKVLKKELNTLILLRVKKLPSK